MIKKSVLLFIIFASFLSSVYSQDFDVVPKVASLEAGYRYVSYSGLDIKTGGWNAQLDMAWQVSGFKDKKKAYISIPLGYGRFFQGGEPGSSVATTLHYGWTIKHDLAKNKKAIPFLGYSLLLNQIWIQGREGHSIGHETRFDFGYDFHTGENRLTYLIKLEYSHMTFPSFDQEESARVGVMSLKTGLRF